MRASKRRQPMLFAAVLTALLLSYLLGLEAGSMRAYNEIQSSRICVIDGGQVRAMSFIEYKDSINNTKAME